MSKQIQRAQDVEKFLNYKAHLPYGLTVAEVRQAMIDTYTFLFDLNSFLVNKGYDRLEDLLLGNSRSGMISEVLVKNLANNSHTLARNRKVGGHPDLIPRGKYPNDEVLRGDEGIEVKTSKQPGGWQGHNPEDAWILIFRYIEDEREGITPLERKPLEFVQVLCAYIKREEWSFSGRSSTSRRTITASITEAGMDKLRSNPVYQNPDYIVAPNRTLREKYRQIQQDFQQR
jgi:hypothetical protein